MRTAIATDQKPNVHEMIVIHRVFRREFSTIPTMMQRVGDDDVARARTVGGHARLVLAGLHMHHVGEEAVLWPRLLERAAPSTGLVETMQSQHQRVAGYADQIGPMLGPWITTGSAACRERLTELMADFATAVFEHLDLEEGEVLPLITRSRSRSGRASANTAERPCPPDSCP